MKTAILRRLPYALALGLLVGAEIYIARYVRDDLIRPYGGDMLAVMAVWALVRCVEPRRWQWLPAAVLAFACAVEVSQALHLADRLGITSPALRIAMGTSFAWGDMAAYAVGAALGGAAELVIRRMREKRVRIATSAEAPVLSSCQPLLAPFGRDKRDTSLISPRCIRHRRRFGEILAMTIAYSRSRCHSEERSDLGIRNTQTQNEGENTDCHGPRAALAMTGKKRREYGDEKDPLPRSGAGAVRRRGGGLRQRAHAPAGKPRRFHPGDAPGRERGGVCHH